jgi:hypothetical protein
MRNHLLLYGACALVFTALVACGDSGESPERPDAGPDARIDAPLPPPPLDADRDGYPAASDCDDTNAARWIMRPYAHRDADGDTRTVPSAGTVCSGGTLPGGYSNTPQGADCDDTDLLIFESKTGYLDADGDLFGDGALLTFCTNGTLPANHVPVAGDCAPVDAAAWTSRDYAFRDVDGDGAAIASSGSVCSGAALPAGYLAQAPPNRPLDCDDADPAIFESLSGYLDEDGDGFGVGSSLTFCTAGQLPAGHAPTAGDCSPNDGTTWTLRAYTHRDADGDGAAIRSAGNVCSGAALPAGYLTQAPAGRPLDCDDADAQIFESLTVYIDGDGDGFGAGPSQLRCTDGTLPPGTSILGSDCDDASNARWMALAYVAVDLDGDGATVPSAGTRCTAGVLLPPYYALAMGLDCDDADPTRTRNLVLYPDGDGDGVGTSPRQVRCLGTAIPAGLSARGYDEDAADPAVVETEDFEELLDLVLN